MHLCTRGPTGLLPNALYTWHFYGFDIASPGSENNRFEFYVGNEMLIYVSGWGGCFLKDVRGKV